MSDRNEKLENIRTESLVSACTKFREFEAVHEETSDMITKPKYPVSAQVYSAEKPIEKLSEVSENLVCYKSESCNVSAKSEKKCSIGSDIELRTKFFTQVER